MEKKKQKPTMESVATFLRLNRDVKRQFKAHCARKGTTMTAELERVMREITNGDNRTM